VTVGMAFFNTLERIPQLKGKCYTDDGQTLMSQGLYVVMHLLRARDPSRVEQSTQVTGQSFSLLRGLFFTHHKRGDKLLEKMWRFIVVNGVY
jgi:hypothetical protein